MAKKSLLTKIEKADIVGKVQRFLEEKVATNPEPYARLGVFLVGTVVCHKLNLAGMLNWFGMATDRVPTGLPGPFAWRRRFPWEAPGKQDLEDKICEWGIPALTSWMIVYHPEAVANLVDAMIPF